MSHLRRTVTLTLSFIWLFIVSSVSVAGFFTKDDFNEVTFEEKIVLDIIDKQEVENVKEENDKVKVKILEKLEKDEEKVTLRNENDSVEVKQVNKEKTDKNQTTEDQKKEIKQQVQVEQPKNERIKYEEEKSKTEKTEDKREEKNSENNNKKSNSSETVATNYKGYDTIGKIEIPKTGLNLPILSRQTIGGMELAPCYTYSTGSLNENGKTLICGHNYRNGKLFSNNNKLQVGDRIFVTSLDGQKVEYVIYSKELLIPEDVSYFDVRESEKPQIILSSCTDDEEKRVVIIAKAI